MRPRNEGRGKREEGREEGSRGNVGRREKMGYAPFDGVLGVLVRQRLRHGGGLDRRGQRRGQREPEPCARRVRDRVIVQEALYAAAQVTVTVF